MTFASGAKYRRADFIEILQMEGMRRDRIDTGGMALLLEHDFGQQIGVINADATPDLATQTYSCSGRFSRNPVPEQIYTDVKDNIRQYVSVGYEILAGREIGFEDGVPVVIVTDWLPIEISIVSVPADTNATLSRALPGFTASVPTNTALEKLPVQLRSHNNNNNNKENKMDEQETLVAERTRASDIITLGAKHRADVMAREFVANGKSVAEFTSALLERSPEAPAVRSAKIDMTDKEVGQYSFLRALHASATGDWRQAGLERSVSAAVAKATGKTARGFLVASDVMTRAVTSQQNVTNFADGGALVATRLRTESFIDALQHRTIVNNLGATILTDIEGSIAIPKEVGLMGVTWVGEDGVAVNTKAQFGQVPMNPKTVLAKTPISRRMMLQSAISAENFVRDRFQKAIALALDHAALVGGGTAQEPKGIYSLLQAAQLMATTGDGYEDAVGLETMVSTQNADLGSLAYVGNAKTRGALKVAQVFPNSGKSVWGDTAVPGVGMVNGYNAFATNHIPGAAPLLFGNFQSLFIALWSGLDVVVDNITDDSGAHIVKVFQDADVALAHLESFAALEA